MYNITWSRKFQILSMFLVIGASSFQLTSLKDVESTQSYLERRSIEAKLEHLWNYITLDSEDKKEEYKSKVQSFFVNSGSLADIHGKEVDNYHSLYSIVSIFSALLALFALLFEHKEEFKTGRTMESKERRR